VPAVYLLITAFVSYLILALTFLQLQNPAQNAWIAFGLAMTPWFVLIFFEVEWTYAHFRWFALFAVLAFVQTIHYSEHCIEVIQIHLFGVHPADAQAIFGQLNIEAVHFAGDTFLTLGTLALLWKYPRNPWLWVAAPFQIVHQAEHIFLVFNYLFEGVPQGGPGLLATNPGAPGAIGGGVGLNRADLHWIYNTLYTIPFVIAFVYQLKRTYDETLDEVFPRANPAELLAATRHAETFRYAQSETVLAGGDETDRTYIVTDGEAIVCECDESGREVAVATLRHGKVFGPKLLAEGAGRGRLVRAKTDLSVLAMEGDTYRHLVTVSREARGAGGSQPSPPMPAPDSADS
jgi:hypothetical protein